jgi:hypothetical protein
MSTLFNKRTVLNLIDRFMFVAYYGSFFLVKYNYINEYIFYLFPVLLLACKAYTGFRNKRDKQSLFLILVFHFVLIFYVLDKM